MVVKTHSVDIFGRYIADVFYLSALSGNRKNKDPESEMIDVQEKGIHAPLDSPNGSFVHVVRDRFF